VVIEFRIGPARGAHGGGARGRRAIMLPSILSANPSGSFSPRSIVRGKFRASERRVRRPQSPLEPRQSHRAGGMIW
jgi:hypothetical protein